VYNAFGGGLSIRVPSWSQMLAKIASSTPVITITGGTILRVPQPGDVVPSGTPDQVWSAMYRPVLPPTASLTGGGNYQRSASSVTHNLSIAYGRQATTNTILTSGGVVFNPGSINKFTTQPAQPGTVSGITQSVTTVANTNTTYSLTVTATGGLSAGSTTSDNWFPNVYYGRSSNTSATTSTEVLAQAGGGNQLRNGHNGTWTVTASGSNYPYIACATDQGHITVFTLTNGTPITTLFVETTVSITNASGYTENYYVYTMNTPQSGNLTFVTN
jgi:hypothetical protein